MLKYKVGDKVYYAKCDNEGKKVICPTCFGKKEITLILGNDERVILQCEGCRHGIDSPSGTITEYDYIVAAEPVTISSIRIEIMGDKEKVEYNQGSYIYNEDELFTNEKEALVKAQEKKALLDKEQQTRAIYLKKNVQKSFAWNAHYHLQRVKQAEKDIKYHQEKARLCKEKIKC